MEWNGEKLGGDNKILSVAEAKSRFSEYISKVAYAGQRYVITKRGKPLVALVSVEDLKSIQSGKDKEKISEMIGKWEYFDEIEFLWRASGITGDLDEEAKRNDWDNLLGSIGKKAEYDLIKSKGNQSETHKFTPAKSRELFKRFWRTAAIFILAFSFSWAAFSFLAQRSQSDLFSFNQVITAKGQKSQIIL